MEEKKPGRPLKNIDPSGTLALFDGINQYDTDTYNDLSQETAERATAVQGPVGGGGAPEYSDQAALDLLWALAHDQTIPAASRIQAAVKHGQEMERRSGRDQAADIPAELAAFLELLRGETAAECDKRL